MSAKEGEAQGLVWEAGGRRRLQCLQAQTWLSVCTVQVLWEQQLHGLGRQPVDQISRGQWEESPRQLL